MKKLSLPGQFLWCRLWKKNNLGKIYFFDTVATLSLITKVLHSEKCPSLLFDGRYTVHSTVQWTILFLFSIKCKRISINDFRDGRLVKNVFDLLWKKILSVIEAEGRELLRSLEQFFPTVKGKSNFWNRMLFKLNPGVFSDLMHQNN